MKKWFTISLTLIALGTLVAALSRWWLPLFGLAGAGNELIHPLENLWPWLVWIFVAVLALLVVNLRWDQIFQRKKMSRLVDEAEEWSDEFRIGNELPLELANQPAAPEPELPKSKVRLFAEQLEPVERQEALPIDASPVPEPSAESVTATVVEPPAPAVKSEPAPAEPVAPLKKQRSERVTVAFADEPEAQVVALPATDELLAPLAQAEEETAADTLTPSSIAHAATIAQAEQLPASYFQLPPLPEAFTGRSAELTALQTAINDPANSGLCIHGAGGVGKTALALALAQQLVHSYPDAQFYLDLQGTSLRPLSTTEVQQYVLRVYQSASDALLPENEIEWTQAYQTALAGKRALLVFDNATDLAQVSQLVPPPGSLLLLTSRQPIPLLGLFQLQLEPLMAAEAETWLLRLIPRVAEQAAAIAQQCGYLPLALRVATSDFLLPSRDLMYWSQRLNQENI